MHALLIKNQPADVSFGNEKAKIVGSSWTISLPTGEIISLQKVHLHRYTSFVYGVG